MTDQPFQLSDAAIEAALARRAPGHADAALLADIVATAATTRQARGWTVPVLGRPRAVWAVVAAAALLVAGLLAVGIGSGQPPSPTPAPSVLGVVPPSAGPSEALPSASAETCATETTQVLVGSAMPPATTGLTTIPAGLLDIGAYLTRTPDGSSNTPTDVWIARSGVSKRIASIVGPDFNIASIDDVSADGQLVLLQIGVIHMTQPGPECSDLYAVRTDGSSVTRVTHYGPNQNAFGGSFSADGRNVAFTYSELNASDAIGVVDVAGLAAPRLGLCDGGPTTGLQVRWAPDDDRLAAFCGTSVQLQFPGSVGSIPVSIGSEHLRRIRLAEPDVDHAWCPPSTEPRSTRRISSGP